VSIPEHRTAPVEPRFPHELEEVVVDTRPLAIVLLSRSVRPFILTAGVVAFALIASMTPLRGLDVSGQRALGIFALAVIYWVTGVIPLMVTSLLVIVMLGASGVMPLRSAYALLGNEAIFFVLAAFMLAAAVNHRRLGRRIALRAFQRFGRTPRGLLLSVYLLTALMSLVIPEHAVAAMILPILMDLVASMELEAGQSGYASALFLAMAWGANIGGIGTLLGGARGPLALGILTEATDQSISFLRWMLAALPLAAFLLAAGYVVLSYCFPFDLTSVEKSTRQLDARAAGLGRMHYEERAVAIILALTVVAWLIGSKTYGLAGIAIIAVVALFVFNLLSWREVEEYVNWGIILMYGGAIALGSALERTGAAAYLVNAALGGTSSTVIAVGGLSLVALLSAEALSHSAVVAALLPVGLGLAHRFGVDVRAITLAVALPAGLTFVLPVGTPAIALAYSSGYLRTNKLLLPGAMMWFCSWVGLNLLMRFYWPLLGLGAFARASLR
jgi:solute carrier family 13 (sodium-dependent dicarboxylate transporter), member 2/3/5